MSFLQWALPRLGLRWQGLRRVRGQVCKRLKRRLDTLHLNNLAEYQALLGRNHEEWKRLDTLCRISISRFYRDRAVYHLLEQELFPKLVNRALSRGDERLRIWSIGCASGEEPYSLALMFAFTDIISRCEVDIVATDSDPNLLGRARRACYPPSSLRDLPVGWRTAFESRGEELCLKPQFRTPVRFLKQDIRKRSADGLFDLILCRNLVFTYFEEPAQIEIARRMAQALVFGGLLVLGVHETLTETVPALEEDRPWLYRCRAV